MKSDWQTSLARWQDAGLVDAPTAARVRDWEAANQGSRHLEWPVLLALTLGGFALGAGILLFVAANWDRISPWARFTMVLGMAALFHVAAAFALSESPRVRSALHALGTIAFGAGLALTAQIFHLPLNWHVGLLLWCCGAWAAWGLLRDVPHTLLVAIATPWWLSAELADRVQDFERPLAGALVVMALTYLTAVIPNNESELRRALMWLGIVAVLPPFVAVQFSFQRDAAFGIALLAVVVPLIPAFLLRGTLAWRNVIAAAWVLLVILLPRQVYAPNGTFSNTFLYHLWSAIASLALIGWGWAEGRAERINLGVIAFAFTVLAYYVSSFWDKLGRSLSLIGLGFLLLGGGWILERIRRRMTAAIA